MIEELLSYAGACFVGQTNPVDKLDSKNVYSYYRQLTDLDQMGSGKDRFRDLFFGGNAATAENGIRAGTGIGNGVLKNQQNDKQLKRQFSRSLMPRFGGSSFSPDRFKDIKEVTEDQEGWLIDVSKKGRKVSIDNLDRSITIAKIREHNTVLKNVNAMDEESSGSETEQSVFKRVTTMIEVHLGDDENLFRILIGNFQDYLLRKYLPIVRKSKTKEVSDFDLANHCLDLCREINDFMKVTVKCLILFYNFDICNFRVGDKATKTVSYVPCTILNFDNLMNFTTVMMFPSEIYVLVLDFMLAKNYSKDRKFADSLEKNQKAITMEGLGVEEKFRLQATTDIKTGDYFKMSSNYSYSKEKNQLLAPLRMVQEEGESLPKSQNTRKMSEMDFEAYERKTLNQQYRNGSPSNSMHRNAANTVIDDPLSNEAYKDAIKTLRYLEEVESPFEKMKVLLMVIRRIIKTINEYYKGRSSDKIEVVTGDQIMSLTVYVVLKARVKNMHTYIEFIETFLPPKMFNTFCGYYLTVFHAATEYISDYGGL